MNEEQIAAFEQYTCRWDDCGNPGCMATRQLIAALRAERQAAERLRAEVERLKRYEALWIRALGIGASSLYQQRLERFDLLLDEAYALVNADTPAPTPEPAP